MIDRIYHYTVATGHGRWSPRSEVSDEAIDAIRKALATFCDLDDLGDDDLLPTAEIVEGFEIRLPMLSEAGVWQYDVGRNGMIYAACWVILTPDQAAEAWPEIRRFADDEEVLCPTACPRLPCLAVMPMLHGSGDRETWMAIADLERCVAWAILSGTP